MSMSQVDYWEKVRHIMCESKSEKSFSPGIDEEYLLIAERSFTKGERRGVWIMGIVSSACLLALYFLISSAVSASVRPGDSIFFTGSILLITSVLGLNFLYWIFDGYHDLFFFLELRSVENKHKRALYKEYYKNTRFGGMGDI